MSDRGTHPNSLIRILFVSADPSDEDRLRCNEECREIQEKLQLAPHRERFVLHQRTSSRPADFSQALLDLSPRVVHFSGHGTATGRLCFEDSLGNSQPVSPDALADLFAQFTHQVECVILNACHSEGQAMAISRHIDYVIGLSQSIEDRASIAFSIGFYQALGANRSVEDAFALGRAQIRLQNLPGHDVHRLIKKQRLSIQTHQTSGADLDSDEVSVENDPATGASLHVGVVSETKVVFEWPSEEFRRPAFEYGPGPHRDGGQSVDHIGTLPVIAVRNTMARGNWLPGHPDRAIMFLLERTYDLRTGDQLRMELEYRANVVVQLAVIGDGGREPDSSFVCVWDYYYPPSLPATANWTSWDSSWLVQPTNPRYDPEKRGTTILLSTKNGDGEFLLRKIKLSRVRW